MNHQQAVAEIVLDDKSVDTLLIALSRISRQVELIKRGNLTVKGCEEDRLDVINRCVDICSEKLK